MISARLLQYWRSIAQATAIAVVLCFGLPAPLTQFVPFLAASPAAATTERDFTEDDVNAAVKKVVGERTKDGAFVFRDKGAAAIPRRGVPGLADGMTKMLLQQEA